MFLICNNNKVEMQISCVLLTQLRSLYWTFYIWVEKNEELYYISSVELLISYIVLLLKASITD